jgi:SAM-dependent methyltransferase
VDTDPALLDPAYKRFPENYQRRLRLYTVIEQLGRPVLGVLPDAQFRFCFVYNFFNYRPLEMINQWLTELRRKLRPGGVLLFTFNDCDWAHGVGLAERKYMSYTPARMLLQQLAALKFTIQEHYHGANDMAWIEAQVPGEITTLRGGQTLAKIVAKTH